MQWTLGMTINLSTFSQVTLQKWALFDIYCVTNQPFGWENYQIMDNQVWGMGIGMIMYRKS